MVKVLYIPISLLSMPTTASPPIVISIPTLWNSYRHLLLPDWIALHHNAMVLSTRLCSFYPTRWDPLFFFISGNLSLLLEPARSDAATLAGIFESQVIFSP